MRAILIATSIRPPVTRLAAEACSPLAPLVDRPFLHHVLASMRDLGAGEIHFVVFDRTEFLKELLGRGERWGATFHYHALPAHEPVYGRLHSLLPPGSADELILLAQADQLPAIEDGLAGPPFRPAIFLSGEDVSDWTGWALVTHGMLAGIPAGADVYRCCTGWRDQMRDHLRFFHMPESLRSTTFEGLLEAQDRVLTKQHGGLALTGREVEENVWMGWNATVHRTARLIAPVYIGENCRVGSQTQLGPGVAMGKGSVVDRFSIVERSMVYPGSYIGQGLEVRDSIVRGNHLVNTRLQAEVHEVDDALLGQIGTPRLAEWLGQAMERVLAALLLALAAPAILLLILRRGWQHRCWPVDSRAIVMEPASRHPERWRTFRQRSVRWPAITGSTPVVEGFTFRAHFVHVFLPGLWNVCCGHLALAGRTPVTPAEQLLRNHLQPGERGKPGLIHPGLFADGFLADGFLADGFLADGFLADDMPLSGEPGKTLRKMRSDYVLGLLRNRRAAPARSGRS